jgi:5'-nucleotidase
VVDALENGVARVEDVSGRFPQVGGLRFAFAPNAEIGSRIVSVDVWDASSGAFTPIDHDATYVVVTNNFLADGGDEYAAFAAAPSRYDTGFLLSDTLAEYLDAHSPVAPQIEGRIERVAAPPTEAEAD